LADAAERVRMLKPLVAHQWGIEELSSDECSGLLGLLEQAHARLRAGSDALAGWHADIQAKLGSEEMQARRRRRAAPAPINARRASDCRRSFGTSSTRRRRRPTRRTRSSARSWARLSGGAPAGACAR
jgi:hypothetical protein